MLEILEEIALGAVGIVHNIAKYPWACPFLLTVVFLGRIGCVRPIISGLFEMHRSKTAVKKALKEYSFWQRVILLHAWRECLHAKRFCRGLIIWYHSVTALYLTGLVLTLLRSVWPGLILFTAWYTFVFMVGVMVPALVLATALDRYPFKKMKHEFRFRKYHNTKNHDSLF